MTDPDGPGAPPPPPGWRPPPPVHPGWQSPPPPPPGWQPAQPASYSAQAPVPHWVAAHRPGAVPLRPLGLADIYDAAFRIIRFNPRATVGSAALVASVAMAVPVLVTAVLTATMDLSLDSSLFSDPQGGSQLDGARIAGLAGSFGSLGLGLVLTGLGSLLVTGMVAHVTAAAALGRRLSLAEAWSATRGGRWRLVGLALALSALTLTLIALYAGAWVLVVVASRESVGLIVVWGVVSVPAFGAFLVWFWVRLAYLPVPALMLERVGVAGAVRRAFTLTRGQFWRTFGIAMLTAFVVGIASQVIGLPVGLLGRAATAMLADRYAVLGLVVTQALTRVVTTSFATPFTSAVTSVQYLDQRMRKEGYDVDLMRQAGVTG